MVGIVVVSHSQKAAEGIRELALELIRQDNQVVAAGGLADGSIGTDAARIIEAINKADSGDGVLIMVDLGSAVMSANLALELLPETHRSTIRIADAPILEGTICAAIQASIGATLDEVLAAACEAREMLKL